MEYIIEFKVKYFLFKRHRTSEHNLRKCFICLKKKKGFCVVCESAPHSSPAGGGEAARSSFADRQVNSRRRRRVLHR